MNLEFIEISQKVDQKPGTESIFDKMDRKDFERPKVQVVSLENGTQRKLQQDNFGELTSVSDSDGRERIRGLGGLWHLYVGGKEVRSPGFKITDLQVSADGKVITMGVVSPHHKGVVLETPKGTIAAREDGEVEGTTDEVMTYKQQALEALKKFLASPKSKDLVIV